MIVNTSTEKVEVNSGDMITIISPWEEGINYVGLVTFTDDMYVHVYHSDINKQIVWSRFVNCIIEKV